jgi:16S rRNA (cytosine967-C5)-methyltransferase
MTGRRSRRKPAPAESTPLNITPISCGRRLALKVLQQHDLTGRFVSDLLKDCDLDHSLTRQERGLAVDIAAGTIRHRRTIDLILQSQISRPRADVEPDLWRILQTATQQLVYGRTPDHAAVDATVGLTRSLGQMRWVGFVNGVLRNIGRLLTDELSTEASRRGVPLPGGQFRLLANDVFACPLTQQVDYFGEAFSMPRAIARRWVQRMSWNDLLTAGFHSLKLPVTSLRVNRLRTTASELTSVFSESGITVRPGTLDESLGLDSAGRIEALPGYAEGLWSIQDESAMAASHALNPLAGELILDLCAAPGGKSTHMAELSNNEAHIFACDVSDDRVDRIRANADRLRHTSITPVLIERDGTGIPDHPFDAALVDVPCSNTGVLSRRPEARWRFNEWELDDLTKLQTRLLMTAFDAVRPGGRIVYSTCSIEPEETTRLVQAIVQAVPSMTLISEQSQLPGQPADGAYFAVLRRADAPSSADEPTP